MSDAALAALTGNQLRLQLIPREDAVFETFYPGPNEKAVDTLASLQIAGAERGFFLCGPVGSGKSHLLQAVCADAAAAGQLAVYLPLAMADQLSAHALVGLESAAVVCIDDVERISGQALWESALSGFLALRENYASRLVISSNVPPAELEVNDPNLKSALAWLSPLELQPLDTSALTLALKVRSARRGFDIPDGTASYLLKRVNADAAMAFKALDALDEVSLGARRQLTVPLVRKVLKAIAPDL